MGSNCVTPVYWVCGFGPSSSWLLSFGSDLVSPCSSALFRWGRRSCLGLRTGVSPHFSMNSVREILALRGGYERGRIPLPSPMPPKSGAPPHNTHPMMLLHSSPLRSPPSPFTSPSTSPTPSPLAPAPPFLLLLLLLRTTTNSRLCDSQPRSTCVSVHR